jgi:trans-2,3-dihydro-3-hydroxyanthranilate isomerase
MLPGVYKYHRVDVFTDRPFGGNPLAVFTNAQGLETATMQSLARELGLSQTTFVFPSSNSSYDYSVRIFSPTTELATGEAPSLGTVFAIARDAEMRAAADRFVLEEQGGAVSVTMVAPVMSMKHPCPRLLDAYPDPDAVLATLSLTRQDLLPGTAPHVVECVVPFTLVPLRSVDALSRIELRIDIWRRTVANSAAPVVVAFAPNGHGPQSVQSRVFAPGLGVHEDAATAPASGAIVAYMLDRSLVSEESAKHVRVRQGVEMGRPSEIHVMLTSKNGVVESLRIGGQCVWMGQGEVNIPPSPPPTVR